MSWFRPKKPAEAEPTSQVPESAGVTTPAAASSRLPVQDDDDVIVTDPIVPEPVKARVAEPTKPAVAPTRARPAYSAQVADGQTVIADDTNIVGGITTTSDLWIAGGVEGNIESGALVHVGDDGVVSGDISAARVRVEQRGSIEGNVSASEIEIHGLVRGNVTCSGRLSVLGTGQIVGDVSAKSLQVDEGAGLQGRCTMLTR